MAEEDAEDTELPWHIYPQNSTLKRRTLSELVDIHPSVLPEEASQHPEAAVIGEAEGIWPNLLDDFKADKLRRVYRQRERPSLVGLAIPSETCSPHTPSKASRFCRGRAYWSAPL